MHTTLAWFVTALLLAAMAHESVRAAVCEGSAAVAHHLAQALSAASMVAMLWLVLPPALSYALAALAALLCAVYAVAGSRGRMVAATAGYHAFTALVMALMFASMATTGRGHAAGAPFDSWGAGMGTAMMLCCGALFAMALRWAVTALQSGVRHEAVGPALAECAMALGMSVMVFAE